MATTIADATEIFAGRIELPRIELPRDITEIILAQAKLLYKKTQDELTTTCKQKDGYSYTISICNHHISELQNTMQDFEYSLSRLNTKLYGIPPSIYGECRTYSDCLLRSVKEGISAEILEEKVKICEAQTRITENDNKVKNLNTYCANLLSWIEPTEKRFIEEDNIVKRIQLSKLDSVRDAEYIERCTQFIKTNKIPKDAFAFLGLGNIKDYIKDSIGCARTKTLSALNIKKLASYIKANQLIEKLFNDTGLSSDSCKIDEELQLQECIREKRNLDSKRSEINWIKDRETYRREREMIEGELKSINCKIEKHTQIIYVVKCIRFLRDDLTYEIPEDAFEKYSNLKFSIELFIEMTHYIKATQFIRILLNDFVKGRILQDIQKHLRLANLSKYATYNDVKSFGKIPINGAPNFYRIADLSVMTIDYDKNLYEKKLMAKLFILCDDDFKRQVYK